jgi:uncharacterized membrane protein
MISIKISVVGESFANLFKRDGAVEPDVGGSASWGLQDLGKR